MWKTHLKESDYVGKHYGMLEVKGIIHKELSGRNRAYFICDCDCGNKGIEIYSDRLKHEKAISCGCMASVLRGNANRSHDESKTRLYSIWEHMKRRCYNPKAAHYAEYGGRGIAVCDEWQSFEPFRDWSLANGYSDELTIERNEVNGNYCPDNCCWATWTEQQRNKRVRSDNTSGVTGVSYRKDTGKWTVSITMPDGTISLGCYKDFDEAVRVRKQAEIKYWNKGA